MSKNEIPENPSPELIARIIADPRVRAATARESLLWFFYLYLGHYAEYSIAPFQREMVTLAQDESIKFLTVMAFRGSAKSTYMAVALPIWAVVGRHQAKHILLLAQTLPQARQMLKNIRDELESNGVLRDDLGPFRQEDDEWRSSSLVLPKYNARITAASMEQSVRGLRHGPHRPDLVILDDLEDAESMKTKESRDKTFGWFTGDIMPIGDADTRFVVVGTLLHEDSLLMRLKKGVEDGTRVGVFRSYPLVDEAGVIAWPAKFPTMAAIEEARLKLGDERAWQRELLLRIIPEEDRVIQASWIQYYESLPDEALATSRHLTGVDLAISQKSWADYTAMVSVTSTGHGERLRIFVLPNPVNRRIGFPETVEQAKSVSRALGKGQWTKVYIEDVGYQTALVQQLVTAGLPAVGVKVGATDKRSRLAAISHLIKSGGVLFPKQGAEDLIRQIVDFGIESHDDLADALVIAVNAAFEKNRNTARMGIGRPDLIDGSRVRFHGRQFGNRIFPC